MKRLLLALVALVAVACAANLFDVTNYRSNDTILKGCPAGFNAGFVVVVDTYLVGNATDTATIADSLKVGSLPVAGKRAYWGLRVRYAPRTGLTDSLDRFAYVTIKDLQDNERTITVRIDSAVIKDTLLKTTACKVTQVIFRGRALNDSFSLAAISYGAVIPFCLDSQALYQYAGLAQETILPRQRGQVGDDGEIYAFLPAGTLAGYDVFAGASFDTCSSELWNYPGMLERWSFGTATRYQKAAGLAIIRAKKLWYKTP